MEDEMYILLQSNSSLDIYPNNTPVKFSVGWNRPLLFEGYWKVALTQFHTLVEDDTRYFFIHTNITQPMICSTEKRPLLRMLSATNDSNEVSFEVFPRIYIPISATTINNIEIEITNEKGEAFKPKANAITFATLHFVRYG